MNTITVPDGLVPANIDLIGVDGNAFAVMGTVARGLRRAGNSPDVIADFQRQAMEGDYDHLLAVAMTFNGDM